MGKKIWFRNHFPRALSLLLRSNQILTDKELEREIKNEEDHFLEEKHGNFIAAVKKWEMLATTKVRISGSEKITEQEKTEHIRHVLHKTFHVVVVQNIERNVQRSVLHVQSCFLLIRPIGPHRPQECPFFSDRVFVFSAQLQEEACKRIRLQRPFLKHPVEYDP